MNSQVQWINHFSASSQIRSLPSDLIEQNGRQVYDFLLLLLVTAPIFLIKGKLPNFKQRVASDVLVVQSNHAAHC